MRKFINKLKQFAINFTSLSRSRNLAVSNLCFIETKRLTVLGFGTGAGEEPLFSTSIIMITFVSHFYVEKQKYDGNAIKTIIIFSVISGEYQPYSSDANTKIEIFNDNSMDKCQISAGRMTFFGFHCIFSLVWQVMLTMNVACVK